MGATVNRVWSRFDGVAMAFPIMLAVVMTYAVGARGPFQETVYFEIALGREGGSGWLYPYDNARLLMMLPYKLATMISAGSYWPFQFIQFLLLALVGVLVTAFVALAWNLSPRVAAVAGSVAVVFGGDMSGAYSGMVIVRQTMVFWLGALVLLALASRLRWWIALLAIPLELAASFTYDPVLIALAVSPLLILATRRIPRVALAVWYLPLVGAIAWQVWRYAIEATTSYQSQQLTAESFGAIAGRLGRLLATALFPVAWPGQWSGMIDATDTSAHLALVGWGLAAIALSIGCATLLPGHAPSMARRPGRLWLAIFSLLLACIGPYLMIRAPFVLFPGPGGPWRSLLLAAVPVALAAGLFAEALSRHRAWQAAVVAMLFACGVTAGVAAQLQDKARWDDYRSVFSSIKRLVPSIRSGTLVVLVGLPPTAECPRCVSTPPGGTSPFTSSIWFNSGLQLAYPGTVVVGTYRDHAGRWAPDMTVVMNPSGIRIPYTNVGVAATNFTPRQVLVIDWNDGHPHVEMGRQAAWSFALSTRAISTNCPVSVDTPLLGSLEADIGAC